MLSYYVSLRSELRLLMFATIYPYKRSSVRLYLQLFVRGILSYLRCFYLACLRLVYSFLIASSVFSNVLLCIVTGANSTEAHYVEAIPVTEEQPYDAI